MIHLTNGTNFTILRLHSKENQMDLKAARLELGMTQVELGKVIYLTPRQIMNMEHGKAKVPPLVVEKLDRLLGATDFQKCV